MHRAFGTECLVSACRTAPLRVPHTERGCSGSLKQSGTTCATTHTALRARHHFPYHHGPGRSAPIFVLVH